MHSIKTKCFPGRRFVLISHWHIEYTYNIQQQTKLAAKYVSSLEFPDWNYPSALKQQFIRNLKIFAFIHNSLLIAKVFQFYVKLFLNVAASTLETKTNEKKTRKNSNGFNKFFYLFK